MWSPEVYERFKRERRQPFDDLLELIHPAPSMRVADLGCGTGELTRELHERLSAASTLGVDSSAEMLAKAASFATGALRFEQGDIASFTSDGPLDLIVSNAAFHWVGGHESLFARLTSMLAPGGQLAIQMPANDTHPSHRIAAEVARDFGLERRPSPMFTPARYASLLHELGFAAQNVRLQVYGHLLPSTGDVVEWNRGALLTHYEAQVDDFEPFLAEYRSRLLRELGETSPFFYTYDRVFVWGRLPGAPPAPR